MTPALRTTYYHSSLPGGQLVVKNPIGWQEITISLDRDPDFHSLVEYFKGDFGWYGSARTTLKAIENASGLNTEVRVVLEVSFKEGVWKLLHDGLMKLSQIEEIYKGTRPYKALCPITRDDFWSKFMNRKDNPVNLEGTTDLDGGTRSAVAKTTVLMRGQTIRKRTFGKRDNNFSPAVFRSKSRIYAQGNYYLDNINEDSGDFASYEYIGTDEPTVNNYFGLNVNQSSQGDYTAEVQHKVKLKLDAIGLFFNDDTVTWDHVIKLVRTNGTIETRTKNILNAAVIGTGGGSSNYDSGYQTFTHNESFTGVTVGDKFYSYFTWLVTDANVQAANIDNSLQFDGSYTNQYFQTSALTNFINTSTDAYLLKDAAEAIISKYVGADNVVTSTKFTNTTFNRNATFRGKHNRGFSFSQKEFSLSLKDWWEAFEPAFNLSLGYTKVAGVNKIFIEDKSFVYNPTPVVNLPYCDNLVRRYDLERYFKSIEIGYKKWSAESNSGIDDPQTKQTRNSGLKTFGKDEKILSEAITAALAIERSRRNRVEQGNDDRLDEDLMLVSVIPDGGNWQLEFDENFDTITNVLNPTKRANLRHTVMRLFRRWANYLNPSLNAGQPFTFGRGEGNYDVTTRLKPTDYEATANPDPLVDEKASVNSASSPRLWEPKIYVHENYAMSFATYEQIRDNRNNALGISLSNSGFVPMHILNLDYQVFKGKANLTLLQATNATI